MDRFKLNHLQSAVVFGAGHGIGLSLAVQLLMTCPKAHIFASYREEHRARELFDLKDKHSDRMSIALVKPLEEDSLRSFHQELASKTDQVDLVLNCIGTLHDAHCRPEKSLSQITLQKLVHSFMINSAITPIIAKSFMPLLRKSPLSLFAAISAKVGSIEDNRLGGWYGYRASKSALNMFVRNIALECTHRSIPCIVLSLHPGTTETSHSRPYIKNSRLNIHSPSQTAVNLLTVLDGKSLQDSGKFFSWDDSEIPW